MVFGSEVSGRRFSHEGRALMDGISFLLKDPREIPHLFCHVKTEKRWLDMNEEVASR